MEEPDELALHDNDEPETPPPLRESPDQQEGDEGDDELENEDIPAINNMLKNLHLERSARLKSKQANNQPKNRSKYKATPSVRAFF